MRFIKCLLLISCLLFGFICQAQRINPTGIDIVRDSFGVPHIFAKTDAEVAYGLAYANAEDDFETMQTAFLSGKSMLGFYKGKAGAQVDYIAYLLRCQQTVEEKYERNISPGFKQLLEGYCQGFNAYARQHPKEVLVKQLLPLTPKDVLAYSILQLCISSGADKALRQIYSGTTATLEDFNSGGSNAYAFNSRKTADGFTYLNINPHQPLEGPVSWYEAHLCSEEGWNITGALFSGAPSILVGNNEFLGWAHTVNYPDKLDTYQLEINPADASEYKFDGSWQKLESRTVRLKVKMLGLPISVKRKVYWSLHGPVVITPKGSFAIRTAPLFEVRSLEQWYRMNKARNFTSFYEAIKMEALPGYNVMYADRYDTIFYISNGKIPMRAQGFNWRGTLPGNTSKTLWNDYHPTEDLPQYLNPSSGYLFNSNHSPFNASGATNNLRVQNFDPTMGFETWENNRSIRFMEMVKPLEKISYDDFKRIKFDRQLPTPLHYIGTNTDTLFLLDAASHPQISDIINILKQWDRRADASSQGAAVFAIIYYYITGKLAQGNDAYHTLTTGRSIEALKYARDYLIQHFGTTGVTLGEYQKLVRGDKILPLPGIPDVIASMESEPWKAGMVKGRTGESFIQLVRFTPTGPLIESIHNYGASKKKNSPHYTDQMQLFIDQQLKPMTLEKQKVYSAAEKIYHPGE